MHILAVVNQKGGVGKTTTATHLSHALALKGKKVLAIDLDPQAQFAASLGVGHHLHGVDWVLAKQQDPATLIVDVRENLYLLPIGFEACWLNRILKPDYCLGSDLQLMLREEFQKYDFVVIDAAASLGFAAVQSLFEVDEILIPVPSDYLSLHGLSYMMAMVKDFEVSLGHALSFWVVVTRFHPRRRLDEEVIEKIKVYFPTRVLQAVIREAAVLAVCPGIGKTVFEYKQHSHSAEEYQLMTDNLLARMAV